MTRFFSPYCAAKPIDLETRAHFGKNGPKLMVIISNTLGAVHPELTWVRGRGAHPGVHTPFDIIVIVGHEARLVKRKSMICGVNGFIRREKRPIAVEWSGRRTCRCK